MVAIVIPAYNAEPYLAECLQSIARQTLGEFRAVVVDDGSTDDTVALAKDFARHDERFSVVEQPKQDAGAARNRGMDEIEDVYYLFFDADDRMDPTMLEQLVARAEETNADVTMCQSRSFDNETGMLLPNKNGPFVSDFTAVVSGAELGDDLFHCCIGWPWDKLFRASFVRRHHLAFQSITSTNDALFVFCAIALAERVAFVDSYLVEHRIHSASIEHTRAAWPHNALKAYQAIYDRLSEEPVWERVGNSCRTWGITHLRWNYQSLPMPERAEAFDDYAQLLRQTAAEQPGAIRFPEDKTAWEALRAADELTPSLALVEQALSCAEERAARERKSEVQAREIGNLQTEIEALRARNDKALDELARSEEALVRRQAELAQSKTELMLAKRELDALAKDGAANDGPEGAVGARVQHKLVATLERTRAAVQRLRG